MIITLDFETRYEVGYSLSVQSTEEYIRDPRFEVIGCGVSVNGARAKWYPQPEVAAILHSLPWSTSSLLAYNTVFDGAILAWHYGLYPALYLDAMGMAKACGMAFKGAGLAKVAEVMGIGAKGDYVVKAKGKRFCDFAPHELAEYGAYCCTDVDLTVEIYRQLKPSFPADEVRIQDANLRLFIEPLLRFDVAALKDHRDSVVKAKEEKIIAAAEHCGIDMMAEEDPVAALQKQMASNLQFAEVLRSLGVDPPTKISPTTGLETYAFAKTDEAFVALQEHEDVAVQAVVAARLGVKSTIEETRAQRFIDIAGRGPWPVQYNYYGANTSRFSGAGNANPQNLKRGGRLRDAILPPPGHVIVAGDLGQIECRMVNYLAGQEDVIEAFRLHDQGLGPDVYCIFAGQIYRVKVTPEDKPKRTVGKVGELSLGYGAGWKAFKQMLFVQGKGMVMTQHEAQNVVDIYRRTHYRVKRLWDEGDNALACMLRGAGFQLGRAGVLTAIMGGIELPNGMVLRYPELRQEYDASRGQVNYVYTKGRKTETVHGAVVVQNCIEALSRLVLTGAWLRLMDRMRVVLHTHDELVAVVPTAKAQWAVEVMAEEMTRPLPWAPGLPIACEVKWGETYGEAKR